MKRKGRPHHLDVAASFSGTAASGLLRHVAFQIDQLL